MQDRVPQISRAPLCLVFEQIIGILKEHEAGLPANEVIRKHAISSAAFYRWKSKCSDMDVAEAKRLKELEAEIAKLQLIVGAITIIE